MLDSMNVTEVNNRNEMFVEKLNKEKEGKTLWARKTRRQGNRQGKF